METYGVDMTVVSNLNGIFYKNTQHANQELHDEINSDKRFAKQIIPFAVINPVYSGWQTDFETCRTKLGMKGIRLHPIHHRYELDHPNCIELVRMARDYNLPVAMSLRMVDARTSSWLDVEKEWSLRDIIPILKEVPDARFLVLNVANSTALSDEELQIFRNTNLIMDTSGRNMNDLGQMLSQFGQEKFAFGTHAPLLDSRTGLLRIEALRDQEADTKTKNLLRFGNIKRFLKL
ncbi:amidohydrolase family protein [Persicitalea jodogahamensis]|nr:amidohydrolase [Persicitalea jodogahamensis]